MYTYFLRGFPDAQRESLFVPGRRGPLQAGALEPWLHGSGLNPALTITIELLDVFLF